MNLCRKHILLVDDEEAFLQCVSAGLKDSDDEFEIFTAENGKMALEVFRNGTAIDLLVTDLNMPEMSGFELLAFINKNFPATRAILLTGLITSEIEEHLKTIGDYVCIDKTVGFRELRRRIRDELRPSSASGEKRHGG
ncbi:MAG: response regulator [Nitrospiraceae bacterium]|nr:response regulator [Nitrospiraceae bacterium]